MKFVVFLLGGFLFSAPVLAKESVPYTSRAKEAILIDTDSGAVLYEKNADTRTVPSSMTKMMTAFIVLEKLKSGELSLSQTFNVSRKAWKKGGAKMFIPHAAKIPVGDLLRGIIVVSGNDASIAMAEGIAGSEEAFAHEMNAKAAELGMTGSHFTNPTGWPDPENYSTCRDLAKLSKATIQLYPELYKKFYSEKKMTYSEIKQPNRNPLLFVKDLGCDGLKTGHTDAGGYGLAASSKKKGRRLILVINGLPSEKARAEEGESLMRFGLSFYDNLRLDQNDLAFKPASVWMGVQNTVKVGLKEKWVKTYPKTQIRNMSLKFELPENIPAPIKAGDKVGQVAVLASDGSVLETLPLFAQEDVERVGSLTRLWRGLKSLLG